MFHQGLLKTSHDESFWVYNVQRLRHSQKLHC